MEDDGIAACGVRERRRRRDGRGPSRRVSDPPSPWRAALGWWYCCYCCCCCCSVLLLASPTPTAAIAPPPASASESGSYHSGAAPLLPPSPEAAERASTAPSGGGRKRRPPRRRSKGGGDDGGGDGDDDVDESDAPRFVEIYENELYDPARRSWYDGPWTDPSGLIESAPPADVSPPVGSEFASDWKIDVTGGGTRDALGWEYLWDSRAGAGGGVGRRRRRWLRAVRPAPPPPPEPESEPEPEPKPGEAEVAEAAKESGRAAPAPPGAGGARKKSSDPFRPVRSAARAVADGYNFKGYGLSFYKSLIFRRSFGVSFRLPLTNNFGWYERHPALPSVSSSAALYYPGTATVSISASLRMEVVRFVFNQMCEWAVFLLMAAAVAGRAAAEASIRGVTLPLMALLKLAEVLATRALGEEPTEGASEGGKKTEKASEEGTVTFLGRALPSPLRRRRIRYSSDVQERVGVSVSWRYSLSRGYEFRVSKFYMYLPRLMFLGGVAGRALDRTSDSDSDSASSPPGDGRVKAKAPGTNGTVADPERNPEDATASGDGRNIFGRNKALVEYLRRHTGSLGINWGYPIPYPPHFSCSAVLSLSGFYYKGLLRRLRRSGAATTFPPWGEGERSAEIGGGGGRDAVGAGGEPAAGMDREDGAAEAGRRGKKARGGGREGRGGAVPHDDSAGEAALDGGGSDERARKVAS